MKPTIKSIMLSVAVVFLASAAMAQNTDPKTSKTTTMKTFVIEREMPNVGLLTQAQLRAASQNSCSVLAELGPQILWDHSYVTGNKIYCVYKAESEELIREHAKKAGLPANKISELVTVISPETAKE